MITGFGKDVSFFCMNHPKPVPFVVMEGNTPFYACPRYMRKDDEHPDGHEPDEKMCMNRLSFHSAQSVLDKMMHIVEKDVKEGVIAADYKGLTFSVDGVDVTVLKYSLDEGIKFGIINRRAIHP